MCTINHLNPRCFISTEGIANTIIVDRFTGRPYYSYRRIRTSSNRLNRDGETGQTICPNRRMRVSVVRQKSVRLFRTKTMVRKIVFRNIALPVLTLRYHSPSRQTSGSLTSTESFGNAVNFCDLKSSKKMHSQIRFSRAIGI